MQRRFLQLLALIAVVVMVPPWPQPARGDSGATREYKLKAAFIFNFIQFTEWPDGAFESRGEPIIIAVFGKDPFEGELERAVAGKQLHGRSLTVRYFANVESVERCHVIFVGESEDPHLSALMERLKGRPILSVGESASFPWAGGVIRFVMEDNKVRFEVNLDAAAQSRLKISSKLLKLGKIFKR